MEPLDLRDNRNNENMRLLSEAIDFFNGAALRFEEHYQHLEKQVKELKTELREKNKALEISLREKEEVKNHLHDILESLTVGIVVIDLEGKITTFNRSAENITGLTATEVRGKKFDRLLGVNFFQDLRLNFESFEDIKENQVLETEIHRKEDTLAHVSLAISPLRTLGGKKIGIVVTLQDVSEMKKLEERANRNGRLLAMGEMAAKIAHEIRNPLGSMELYSSTLKKDLEHFTESKKLAEHISAGVKTINNIISNLLLFIRPEQKADFQIIDIHDSLKDSLFFSNHLIESTAAIEVIANYPSEPLFVRGDQELLKQIYLNLMLNAIQSMPQGGKLTICTRRIDDNSKTSAFAEIRIKDTGLGISRGDMSRIFDPFFTTKKRGTGLGLPIVHNIVKLHGGTIDINSSENNGTECIISLPLWKGNYGV